MRSVDLAESAQRLAHAPLGDARLGLVGLRHAELQGLLEQPKRARVVLLVEMSPVALVTAFTAAHSLTLALAVLGCLSVPSAMVEPLIATSILFVGVENLFRARQPEQPATRLRVALTFAFGLLHGLGFAGALQELRLDARSLPVALFAFNLGVELGQLAVAAAVFPLMLQLRRSALGLRSLSVVSIAIAALGAVWLVQRLTVSSS